MASEPLRPKTRRKLSRRQVQAILERNVELYREEDSFIPYLMDLSVYLLEYEYDWADSDTEIPEAVRKARAKVKSITQIEDVPNFHRIEDTPRTADIREGLPRSKHLISGGFAPIAEVRLCPSCGGQTTDGDQVCPICRNSL